ncbi:saccharopine dehydrogenase family protein [Maritimibacter alexandrii]|uniref:saccharopine dehydrogenase family protein n=1 Tax=Maritimibacter alexandrii TaxID=2570355 RepID=UPI0011085D3B|nr:saccharopine dehydrogenase NADP-binding domain-containing protein [Maritimibacter alexandrii]
MAGQILIYGAYGYTGELIAREAVKMGLTPRLGGRDATRLGPLAEDLGLEWVAFGVDDRAATRAALDGIDTLLNCAGPFRETYAALTEACLATHTHYLDITGEIDVLAGCAALDERAKAAGITIMPGTGFDVVPTDCMAAMLKERLPDANKLTLAFKGMAQASRGTAMSSIPHLGNPPYVRRDGDLVPRPGGVFSTLDMGEGPERVAAISWGDIVTAWHTTGIPNIEVFLVPPKDMVTLLKLPLFLRRFLAGAGRPIVNRVLARMPEGPDATARSTGRCIVYGRAENAKGDSVQHVMTTAEGYHLTSLTATRIAEAVSEGQTAPGFLTPARAFGSDYILGFEGSVLRN